MEAIRLAALCQAGRQAEALFDSIDARGIIVPGRTERGRAGHLRAGGT